MRMVHLFAIRQRLLHTPAKSRCTEANFNLFLRQLRRKFGLIFPRRQSAKNAATGSLLTTTHFNNDIADDAEQLFRDYLGHRA